MFLVSTRAQKEVKKNKKMDRYEKVREKFGDDRLFFFNSFFLRNIGNQ